MSRKEGDKIFVLVKRPGEPPRHVWVSNRLVALQNNVDGYIETVNVGSGMALICNEEGRLMGLPYNCTVNGVDFVGTILIVGVEDGEFADLPVSWPKMKERFPQLWEAPA